MKSAISAIASMLGSYWASHSVKGKFWLIIGVLALIVDAKLCFEYGVTQTTWHGVGFAVVALLFSQLPDGAYEEYAKGNTGAGIMLAILCVPLGAVAYQSHIGYGAGVRMGDIKKAGVQQAKYEDSRDDVSKAKTNAEFFENRAKELDAELAKLVSIKVGEWAVSVKPSAPDELDGQIAAKELEVANESKKVRCGDRCEARTRELGHLKALRSKAAEIKANNDQHSAALAGLSKAKNASANTDAGMSSVAMQTDVNTQLFGVVRAAWTGEPLEAALKTTENSAKLANLIITAAGSLAFMIAAPIGFFMAGRNRRESDTYEDTRPTGTLYRSQAPSLPSVIGIPQTNHVHTRETVRENPMAAKSLADIRRLIESRHGVTA